MPLSDICRKDNTLIASRKDAKRAADISRTRSNHKERWGTLPVVIRSRHFTSTWPIYTGSHVCSPPYGNLLIHKISCDCFDQRQVRHISSEGGAQQRLSGVCRLGNSDLRQWRCGAAFSPNYGSTDCLVYSIQTGFKFSNRKGASNVELYVCQISESESERLAYTSKIHMFCSQLFET